MLKLKLSFKDKVKQWGLLNSNDIIIADFKSKLIFIYHNNYDHNYYVYFINRNCIMQKGINFNLNFSDELNNDKYFNTILTNSDKRKIIKAVNKLKKYQIFS